MQGYSGLTELNLIQMPVDSAPIGAEQVFTGNILPAGYLIEDGSAVSRTTYSELFAQIGTTYGAGDGSTTFNLPNAYSYIRRTLGKTKGSSNTNVIIYAGDGGSSGTDISYVNSATNGDSFTINTSGIYSVSMAVVNVTADSLGGIHVGTLNNTIGGTQGRAFGQNAHANSCGGCSWTGYIAAGNSVWCMTPSAIYNDDNFNQVTIVRVA